MNQEEATNFLVEHAAKLDADLAGLKSEVAEIKSTMATKQEFAELRDSMLAYARHISR